MSGEFIQNFRALAHRAAPFSAPRWLIYFYVIALSLAYVTIRVYTPLTLIPGAPHDDGLYMSLGRSLAERHWLGHYNEFTLMKGPGYSAFLAIANWLGISASLAHALLYCAAAVFFVAVAHRFVRSHLISGLFLALLLGQLLPATVVINRILREQITGSQTLFLFAAAAGAFFYARGKKSRLWLAALTGFFLGWLWLTREEGVWILPAAVLLIGIAANRGHRILRLREFAGTLAIAIAVFAAVQLGFAAVNWAAYGKFAGVDFKEANFQRALRAIDSVRSGGTKDFVSITHAAMKRVDTVSPAFASLAPYFDRHSMGWESFTCSVYPSACGEIGSGWFVWALRGAAQTMGHYSSPGEASAFYGQIADEITAACARGALICEPQLIAEMPPINWSVVIGRMPSLYARAFDYLLMIHPPLQLGPSAGSEAELDAALRFLNHPLYTKPINAAAGTEPRLDVVSGRSRQAVLNGYAYLFIPVLTIGFICFLTASAFHWRRAFFNVSYILALCSWVLVVSRTSMIVLIAATSFPALSPLYLWPAHLFLVSGALFSCAAWLQLSGRTEPRTSAV